MHRREGSTWTTSPERLWRRPGLCGGRESARTHHVAVPDYTPVTGIDGQCHDVDDAAYAAGAGHGLYATRCGQEVLAAALTAGPRSACPVCVARRGWPAA